MPCLLYTSDVLREIRKQYTTPVIMLSAKGETFDKVLGLELGADDYIIKPFVSPLTKKSPEDPRLTERFEFFINRSRCV